MRGARKPRRKRYRSYDRRGKLGGQRLIGQRPRSVAGRRRIGHWEIDTVHGRGRAGVVTLVERKSGSGASGKLAAATVVETNAATLALLRRHRGRVRTITTDNGSEFHGSARLEKASGAKFYFATPHHARERGTRENTNGRIRQSLPKKTNLTELTQKARVPQMERVKLFQFVVMSKFGVSRLGRNLEWVTGSGGRKIRDHTSLSDFGGLHGK